MPHDLSPDNPIASMEDPYVTATGTPITPRIKDVQTARSLYEKYWRADSQSRAKRAMVQAMVDSEPPFDSARLKRNGMSSATNIDFRYGAVALEKAMAPYLDAIASTPTLMNIKTKFGDIDQRAGWEYIISDEWSRMLRSWEHFDYRQQYLVQYLLTHGVAACYRSDNLTWPWEVTTLGEMVLPRDVKASDSEVPMVCLNKDLQPEALYAFMKEYKDDGEWNKKEIIRAIRDASPSTQGSMDEDWEKLEREIKGNSINYYATPDVTKIVFMWSLEVDGSVTQYIFRRDGGDDDDFIYKKSGYFNRMSEGITIFTYGIGSDAFLHSVRGYAARIYPIVDTLNRLRCKFIDALIVESCIPIKANEEALNEMAFTINGPFMIYNENVEVMDRANPDYSNSLLPAFQMLDADFDKQMVGYSGQAPSGNQEKSKYQFQIEAEMAGGLKIAQSSAFYNPMERHLKETLKRSIRKDYDPVEVGGREVADFRLRCFKRGVPREAIDNIDVQSSTITRAIGNGSPAARLSAMQQLGSSYARMDEQGKQNYDRDMAAATPGTSYDMIERYFPLPQDIRPDMNISIAQLENFPLMSGGVVQILPNQPHLLHAKEHMTPILEMVTQVEQGQVLIEDVVTKLAPLHEHASQHILLAGETDANQQEVAQIRQALQQTGEVIVNGQKHLQKLQKEQAEQGGAQNGEAVAAQAEVDRNTIKAQIELAKASESSVRAQEVHAAKMQQLIMDGEQNRAIKDAKAAANL